MRRLSLALALSLAALAAVGSLASSPVVASAPLERVIVVLHPEVNLPEDVALQVANVMDGNVGFVYHHALNGFSLELPAAAVAALEQSPLVAYVEPDIEVSVVQLGSQPVPTGVDRVEADLNPPAGPVDADIAVLDTGIWHGPGLSSHEDLNLTVVSDCTDAIFYPIFGGCAAGPTANFQDEHGHGTHVAGIAAAIDNDIGIIGTAPGARLWSIKVAGADGTALLGSILAGVDLVAANAPEIEVANVSLTMTGSSTALNDALSNATSAGVVFVVAAGNSSADAAGFSPANHPNVIT
ncbi:MAG: S8 family serine peptidase, partial [Acidimicrobiia bacterium]